MTVWLLCKRISVYRNYALQYAKKKRHHVNNFQWIRKQKLFVLYLQHFWVCFSKKVNKGRNISNCSPNSMQAGSYHVSKETRAILSGGKWREHLYLEIPSTNKEQFWSTRLKRESIKRLHTECRLQFPSPVLTAEHQQQEYIRSSPPGVGFIFSLSTSRMLEPWNESTGDTHIHSFPTSILSFLWTSKPHPHKELPSALSHPTLK